jgi:hypothetical protein
LVRPPSGSRLEIKTHERKREKRITTASTSSSDVVVLLLSGSSIYPEKKKKKIKINQLLLLLLLLLPFVYDGRQGFGQLQQRQRTNAEEGHRVRDTKPTVFFF